MSRLAFYIILFLFISCGHDQKLTEIKEFQHYPSASGIEYFNKQFFIIGDDAKDILILDSNMAVKDSVFLFASGTKRIPKDIKPDFEAITLLRDKKRLSLLLFGSGSSSLRNKMLFIDPYTFQKDSVQLDTLYERLKLYGLNEINIEGVCHASGYIILANRGHKAWPKNHLVFLRNEFWKNQTQTQIITIRIGANADTSVFNGVSGLAYAAKGDRLLLTVSTEDTRSTYEDGAIGKSYLWIVDNISTKRGWKAINPNVVIDLEEIDQRFKGHKIESVCVTKEDKNFIYLVLAADDDKGSSTLFRMIIKKK
jgi:hypothetical protein